MTTVTATTTQVYRVFIRATPEAIWDAITNPEFTQKYFYGMSISLVGDRRITHTPDGDELSNEAVIEKDPPRKLVHEWQSNWDPDMGAEPASRVTWEIEQGDDGVSLLTVVHDKLESSPKTAAGVAGGWMRVLSGLKTLVETGEPLV
jgi:uncharacterized protein YndB with AHSA1/START domain